MFRFLVPAPLDAWIIATFFGACLCIAAGLIGPNRPVRFEAKTLVNVPMLLTLAMLVGMTLAECMRPVRVRFRVAAITAIGVFWFLYLAQPIWPARGPLIFDTDKFFDTAETSSAGDANAIASPWGVATCLAAVAWIAVCVFRLRQSKRRPTADDADGPYSKQDSPNQQGFSLLKFGADVFDLAAKHRQRVLIGLLAIGLPATVIRNMLGSPGLFHSLAIRGLVGITIVMVVVLILKMGHQLSKTGWGRAVVFVGTRLLFAFLLSALAASQVDSAKTMEDLLAAATVWVSILVGVAAWRFGWVSAAHRSPWMSVWTIALLIGMALATRHVASRYDVYSLVVSAVANRGDPWDVLFEAESAAAYSRKLQAASDDSIRYCGGDSVGAAFVTIDERTDPRCLKALSERMGRRYVRLKIANLRPGIETASLNKKQLWGVDLVGGEVSAQQMRDLSPAAGAVRLFNVRRVGSGELDDASKSTGKGNANGAVRITVVSDQPLDGLAGLLSDYAMDNASRITLDLPLSMEDWKAAVDVSRRMDVFIVSVDQVPAGGLEALGGKPAGELYFGQIDLSPDREMILEFAQLGIDINSEGREDLPFWDMVFAFPQTLQWGEDRYMLTVDLGDQENDGNWVYGRNSDNAITHLWVPNQRPLLSHFEHLGELETLRLDRDGVVGLGYYSGSVEPPIDLKPFSKLKRLYLDSRTKIDSLSFLRSVPQLRHLQIPAASRPPGEPAGFEVLTQLESIRFFGVPDAPTIAELKTLPHLKRVEIVAGLNEYLTPAEVKVEREKIQAPFGSLEVRWIESQEASPDLSERFLEHRERIRKRVFGSVPSK
ncbi:MAG: hypothetical protein AAF958_17925 [Planctomycetota bacterium]